MKLEVGKKYWSRDRSGIVEIVKDSLMPPFKYASQTGASYMENGQTSIGRESSFDLVDEWIDPNIPLKESKIKQVYMTTDGQSFGTSEEAESHQTIVDTKTDIDSLVGEYADEFGEMDVADFIIDNKFALLDILNKLTKE